MALNFPQSPTLNQESVQNGIRYKWTGVKWKRLDTITNPVVSEYTDIGFYSGNNVVLDTSRYNYHKVELTGNTSISVPNMGLYSSNTIEIKRPFYSDQAYSLTAASYAGETDSIGGTATYARGIVFKPDGTRVYYVGVVTSVKLIYQADLASPWDITSYIYSTLKSSPDLSGTTTLPHGLAFNPQGTVVYIAKSDQTQVQGHTLTTPWDITTMSTSASTAINMQYMRSVSFKPDGTKIYGYTGSGTTGLYEYILPTPWNLGNPVGPYIKQGLTSQDANPYDIYFHPDGTKFFMAGGTSNTVYQYDMSTPWQANTATYSGKSLNVGVSARGIAFGDSGTKMCVTSTAFSIKQYSTYNTPNITLNWPTDVKWEAGSAPSINTGQTSLINITNFGDNKIIGNSLSLALGKT